MMIKDARFITSAARSSQYPPENLPEVAFAGRSNVGKSSLINTLVNRKRLVKTSRTPGRTQLINFFLINESIMLVDLPGYGYAKVPEAVRRKWRPMIETYLTNRTVLKTVVLLLDIRRDVGDREHLFIDWLALHHLPVILVLTKADKLSKAVGNRRLHKIRLKINNPETPIFDFSAKTGKGREAIWQAIEAFI